MRLYNKMSQHLEDWHHSVKQCFPHDQCVMLMDKRSIQTTTQTNATEFEIFIGMISDSTLQPTNRH